MGERVVSWAATESIRPLSDRVDLRCPFSWLDKACLNNSVAAGSMWLDNSVAFLSFVGPTGARDRVTGTVCEVFNNKRVKKHKNSKIPQNAKTHTCKPT